MSLIFSGITLPEVDIGNQLKAWHLLTLRLPAISISCTVFFFLVGQKSVTFFEQISQTEIHSESNFSTQNCPLYLTATLSYMMIDLLKILLETIPISCK